MTKSELRAEIADLKGQLRIANIKPITRAEVLANIAYAVKHNETFYIGAPCKHGHGSLRYKTRHCVTCRSIIESNRRKERRTITPDNVRTMAW